MEERREGGKGAAGGVGRSAGGGKVKEADKKVNVGRIKMRCPTVRQLPLSFTLF